jgi:small subunit ribosomal protein S6
LRPYEALVITRTAGDASKKSTFEDLVKKHGGKVLNQNDLGKRLLGYEVKKTKDGFVASYDFELGPDKVDGFKRSLQLAEDVLKYTLVLKPKPPKTPKARNRPDRKPKVVGVVSGQKG